MYVLLEYEHNLGFFEENYLQIQFQKRLWINGKQIPMIGTRINVNTSVFTN